VQIIPPVTTQAVIIPQTVPVMLTVSTRQHKPATKTVFLPLICWEDKDKKSPDESLKIATKPPQGGRDKVPNIGL
jgi:hypothetical protein